jgi:tRNA nucleotidyltransferase/poly(A) polymerase
MERVFRKMARLIENLDHHPLKVVFYDIKEEDKERLVPIYEEALDRDGDLILKLARIGSDMAAFKEIPRHMWYSTMRPKQTAISYEETEDFYEELYSRYQRLLRFKIREYVVKRVGEEARIFLASYEKFLDNKILEEEQKARNIQEALPLLTAQAWEVKNIAIYCAPIYYEGLHARLEKSPKKDISKLLEAMKPFTQKNRIMQGNYNLALNILGLKRPAKYSTPSTCLCPLKKEATSSTQHWT